MNTRIPVPALLRATRFAAALAVVAMAFGCSAYPSAPSGWQVSAPSEWRSNSHPGELLTGSEAPFQGALSDLASTVLEGLVLAPGGGRMERTTPFAPCPGMVGEMIFQARTPRERVVAFYAIRNGRSYVLRWSGPAQDLPPVEILSFVEARLCRVS